MKITNKLNLPEPIFRACQNDDYTKGDADYSATQLLRPSWMNYLSKKHNGEIEKDCSNMLWALQGKAMHLLLERNASKHDLIEQRFNWSFDGIVISQKSLEYTASIFLKKKFYRWKNTDNLRLIDLARMFEEADSKNRLKALLQINKIYKHYRTNIL